MAFGQNSGGNSRSARSARAKKQLRDKKGRWIEMGRSRVTWYSSANKKNLSGTAMDTDGKNAFVRTDDGKMHAVSGRKLEIIDHKVTLPAEGDKGAPAQRQGRSESAPETSDEVDSTEADPTDDEGAEAPSETEQEVEPAREDAVSDDPQLNDVYDENGELLLTGEPFLESGSDPLEEAILESERVTENTSVYGDQVYIGHDGRKGNNYKGDKKSSFTNAHGETMKMGNVFYDRNTGKPIFFKSEDAYHLLTAGDNPLAAKVDDTDEGLKLNIMSAKKATRHQRLTSFDVNDLTQETPGNMKWKTGTELDLSSANTPAKFKKAVNAKYPSVNVMIGRGFDLEVAKLQAKAWDVNMERYPELQRSLNEVRFGVPLSGAVAAVSMRGSGEIKNGTSFRFGQYDNDGAREFYKFGVKDNGYVAPANFDSPESVWQNVADHETGHAIQEHIDIQEQGQHDYDAMEGRISQFLDGVDKNNAMSRSSVVGGMLSKYGASLQVETVAESHADLMTNGEDGRPISHVAMGYLSQFFPKLKETLPNLKSVEEAIRDEDAKQAQYLEGDQVTIPAHKVSNHILENLPVGSRLYAHDNVWDTPSYFDKVADNEWSNNKGNTVDDAAVQKELANGRGHNRNTDHYRGKTRSAYVDKTSFANTQEGDRLDFSDSSFRYDESGRWRGIDPDNGSDLNTYLSDRELHSKVLRENYKVQKADSGTEEETPEEAPIDVEAPEDNNDNNVNGTGLSVSELEALAAEAGLFSTIHGERVSAIDPDLWDVPELDKLDEAPEGFSYTYTNSNGETFAPNQLLWDENGNSFRMTRPVKDGQSVYVRQDTARRAMQIADLVEQDLSVEEMRAKRDEIWAAPLGPDDFEAFDLEKVTATPPADKAWDTTNPIKLNDVSTIEGLRGVMQKKYPTLRVNIPDDANPDTARRFANAFDKNVRRYPATAGFISEFRTFGDDTVVNGKERHGAMAMISNTRMGGVFETRNQYGGGLVFSFNRDLNRNRANDAVRRGVSQGHFNRDLRGIEPYDYISAHEFGHVLDYKAQSTSGAQWDNSSLDKLVNDYLDSMNPSNYKQGLIGREVSNYGRTLSYEAIAESVAQAATNPEAMKPLAKVIVSAMAEHDPELAKIFPEKVTIDGLVKENREKFESTDRDYVNGDTVTQEMLDSLPVGAMFYDGALGGVVKTDKGWMQNYGGSLMGDTAVLNRISGSEKYLDRTAYANFVPGQKYNMPDGEEYQFNGLDDERPWVRTRTNRKYGAEKIDSIIRSHPDAIDAMFNDRQDSSEDQEETTPEPEVTEEETPAPEAQPERAPAPAPEALPEPSGVPTKPGEWQSSAPKTGEAGTVVKEKKPKAPGTKGRAAVQRTYYDENGNAFTDGSVVVDKRTGEKVTITGGITDNRAGFEREDGTTGSSDVRNFKNVADKPSDEDPTPPVTLPAPEKSSEPVDGDVPESDVQSEPETEETPTGEEESVPETAPAKPEAKLPLFARRVMRDNAGKTPKAEYAGENAERNQVAYRKAWRLSEKDSADMSDLDGIADPEERNAAYDGWTDSSVGRDFGHSWFQDNVNDGTETPTPEVEPEEEENQPEQAPAPAPAEEETAPEPETTPWTQPETAPEPETTPWTQPESSPETIDEDDDSLVPGTDIRRTEPVALEGEKFPPTRQQQDVIDSVVAGKDTLVQAKAGAGKTTTLEAISRRLKEWRGDSASVLYIAFNKSVQKEAENRMPNNVESRTGHSLSYKWAPEWQLERMGGGTDPASKARGRERQKNALRNNKDIARFLGITKDLEVGETTYTKEQQAADAVRTVDRYAYSADDEIGPQHLAEGAEDMTPAMQEAVLANARKVWADLSDENGQIKFTFDHNRKHWALSRPDFTKLGSGNEKVGQVLFLDEAQDTPPVLAKVVADQKMQKVIVGDADQAIYGFTGATDFLSQAEHDVELPLNKSWRFGPQVADAGNRFLQMLGSKGRVVGGGPDSKIVNGMENADAILTRTNAGMIKAILEELERDRTVGVPKGTKADMEKLFNHAADLRAGRIPSSASRFHEDLAKFKTWEEFEKEAMNEGDPKVTMIFGLIETHGIAKLQDIMRQVKDPADKKESNWQNPDLPDNIADEVEIDPETGKITVGSYNLHRRLQEYSGNSRGLSGADYTFVNKGNKRGQKWWEPKAKTPEGRQKAIEKLQKMMDDASASEKYQKALAVQNEGAEADKPDVIVSTAHKAKGLEWGRVRIGDDFKKPKMNKKTGLMEWPSEEENRLHYVAVTRAEKELDPGGLAWVYNYTDDNGGDPESDDTETPTPQDDSEDTTPSVPEDTDPEDGQTEEEPEIDTTPDSEEEPPAEAEEEVEPSSPEEEESAPEDEDEPQPRQEVTKDAGAVTDGDLDEAEPDTGLYVDGKPFARKDGQGWIDKKGKPLTNRRILGDIFMGREATFRPDDQEWSGASREGESVPTPAPGESGSSKMLPGIIDGSDPDLGRKLTEAPEGSQIKGPPNSSGGYMIYAKGKDGLWRVQNYYRQDGRPKQIDVNQYAPFSGENVAKAIAKSNGQYEFFNPRGQKDESPESEPEVETNGDDRDPSKVHDLAEGENHIGLFQNAPSGAVVKATGVSRNYNSYKKVGDDEWEDGYGEKKTDRQVADYVEHSNGQFVYSPNEKKSLWESDNDSDETTPETQPEEETETPTPTPEPEEEVTPEEEVEEEEEDGPLVNGKTIPKGVSYHDLKNAPSGARVQGSNGTVFDKDEDGHWIGDDGEVVTGTGVARAINKGNEEFRYFEDGKPSGETTPEEDTETTPEEEETPTPAPAPAPEPQPAKKPKSAATRKTFRIPSHQITEKTLDMADEGAGVYTDGGKPLAWKKDGKWITKTGKTVNKQAIVDYLNENAKEGVFVFNDPNFPKGGKTAPTPAGDSAPKPSGEAPKAPSSGSTTPRATGTPSTVEKTTVPRPAGQKGRPQVNRTFFDANGNGYTNEDFVINSKNGEEYEVMKGVTDQKVSIRNTRTGETSTVDTKFLSFARRGGNSGTVEEAPATPSRAKAPESNPAPRKGYKVEGGRTIGSDSKGKYFVDAEGKKVYYGQEVTWTKKGQTFTGKVGAVNPSDNTVKVLLPPDYSPNNFKRIQTHRVKGI